MKLGLRARARTRHAVTEYTQSGEKRTRDSNGVHRVFLDLRGSLWTAAGLAARISLRHPLTRRATANRRAPPLRAGRGREGGGRERRPRRAGRLRGRELDPARRGFPRCRKVRKKRPAAVFNRAKRRERARRGEGEEDQGGTRSG